jgi:hypothetical protein
LSYYFTHVKRYKRGAKWESGETRTCTRCRIEKSRARQAKVTAFLKYSGTKFVVPVAYCEEHDVTGGDEEE